MENMACPLTIILDSNFHQLPTRTHHLPLKIFLAALQPAQTNSQLSLKQHTNRQPERDGYL
tara:strand:+ start:387 stop:569 length:183 start_codon:yes stop_codon:yes gene_type:complete